MIEQIISVIKQSNKKKSSLKKKNVCFMTEEELMEKENIKLEESTRL